jgi:hypothetical protein
LPILDQEAGQFLLVDFPSLADGAVSFLYGGSPLQPRHPRRSDYILFWKIVRAYREMRDILGEGRHEG